MSAIENPIVAPGPAHIENEQEADLGGERHLPAGGGVQDVVEANITQATDTVKDAVPKAETPTGGDQALAEADSDLMNGSSSADSSSDTLTDEIDDERSNGAGKGTDSDSDGDSDDDSDDDDSDDDSDSGLDFFTRYQPRGDGVPPFSGRSAPPGSGLKSTNPPKGQPTVQPTNEAQKSTTKDTKSGKTDDKSGKMDDKSGKTDSKSSKTDNKSNKTDRSGKR